MNLLKDDKHLLAIACLKFLVSDVRVYRAGLCVLIAMRGCLRTVQYIERDESETVRQGKKLLRTVIICNV